MKKIISVFLMLFLGVITNAQTSLGLSWAKSLVKSSSSYNNQGRSIVHDAAGNIYVTGDFQGTVDFDPSSTATATLISSNIDIFLAKYDANGNYVFAQKIGGSSADVGYSITMDTFGNIYITGTFQGTVDFDPSPTTTATLTSAGQTDIFIAKYDANGNYMYAKNVGGSDADYGNSIAVDASGNAYITGQFRGTADFDPSLAIAMLTSTGTGDIFFAKYDINGNYVYAKNIVGNSNYDSGNSIAVDALGNVYITGVFYDTYADFDPSPTSTVTLINAGSADIFLAKYDVNGNYVYAMSMGDSYNDYSHDIALDASGNAYITGYFQGTVDFDPSANTVNLTSNGSVDIFLAKYNASGNYVYAKNIGSSDSEIGYGVVVDASGNAHVTGIFYGTVDLDPSPTATAIYSASNNYNIFLAKYDALGNYVHAINIGDVYDDYSYGGIAIDALGNTYIAGRFTGVVDFDPSVAGGANLTGNYDIFVAKYRECNYTTSIFSHTVCGSYTWINGITYTASINTPTYMLVSTGGCDSLVTLNLTVYIIPTVAVTSATICSGNSVTLVPSGANTYTISGGTFTVNPVSTNSYSVIGTGTNGCISSNTAVASVSVNISPTVSVNSETICSGKSTILNPSGASTYTITDNNTFNTTTNGNIVISPNITTSYSVIGINAAGCISSNTPVSTISVNITPTVTINSATICSGNSFVLVPNGADTYSITGNNYTVNPNVTTSYTVTGTDAINGCTNIAVALVSVNITPTVSANSATICSGNSAIIVPSGANTYTITGGAFTVSPNSTNSYSVTGAANGCLSSNTAIANVLVYITPTLTISSPTVCYGATGMLTISGTNSYTWNIGAQSSSITVVTPTITSHYTITGLSAENCSATTTATLHVLAPPPIPQICEATTDSASFYNHNVVYWENTQYASADSFMVYRYDVSLNSYLKIGTVSHSIGQFMDTARYMGSLAGTNGDPNYSANRYKIALKDTCGNISAQSPYHLTEFLQNQLNGNFNVSAYGVENGQTNPVTGYALLRDDNNTGVYQAIAAIPSGATSATDPQYSNYPNANYRVDVFGFNCNIGGSGSKVAGEIVKAHSNTAKRIINVGITPLEKQNAIMKIYPNPNDGVFTIEAVENARISVMNAFGQVVFEIATTSNKTEISLKEFANGIYFVKVAANNKQQVVKMIKQ